MADSCRVKEVDLTIFKTFQRDLANPSPEMEKKLRQLPPALLRFIPKLFQLDEKKGDGFSKGNADSKAQLGEVTNAFTKQMSTSEFVDADTKKILDGAQIDKAQCAAISFWSRVEEQLLKNFPGLRKEAELSSVVDISLLFADTKNIDPDNIEKNALLPFLSEFPSDLPSEVRTLEQFKTWENANGVIENSAMPKELKNALKEDSELFRICRSTKEYVSGVNSSHHDPYNLIPKEGKSESGLVRADTKLDRSEAEFSVSVRGSQTPFEYLEAVRKRIPKLVIAAYLIRKLIEPKLPAAEQMGLADLAKKDKLHPAFFAALRSSSPTLFDKHPVLKEFIPILFVKDKDSIGATIYRDELRPEMVGKILTYRDFYDLANKTEREAKKLWDDITTLQEQILGEPYAGWPASLKGIVHALDKTERDYLQKLYVGERQKEIATVVHYLEMAERTNYEYGQCQIEENCKEDDESRKKREIKYATHETHEVPKRWLAYVPPFRFAEYSLESRLHDQHTALDRFKKLIHEHPTDDIKTLCEKFQKSNPADYDQLEKELYLPHWRTLADIKEPEKFNDKRIELATGFRDGTAIVDQSFWRREFAPMRINGKWVWEREMNPRLAEAMFVELQEESPEAITIFTKPGLPQLLDQIDFTNAEMEKKGRALARFDASKPSELDEKAYQKWEEEKAGKESEFSEWEIYKQKRDQAKQARQYYEQMRLGLIRGTFILANEQQLSESLQRFKTPAYNLQVVYQTLGAYVAEIQLLNAADKIKGGIAEKPNGSSDVDFLEKTITKVMKGKLVDAEEIKKRLGKYVPNFQPEDVRLSLEGYARLIDRLKADQKKGTSGDGSGESLLKQISGYTFKGKPESLAAFLQLAFDPRIPTKKKIEEAKKIDLSAPDGASMISNFYKRFKGEEVDQYVGIKTVIDYLKYLQRANLTPPAGELALSRLTGYEALIKEGFPNPVDQAEVRKAIDNPQPDDPVDSNKKPRTAFKRLITSTASRLSERNVKRLLKIYDNMANEKASIVAYAQWLDLSGRQEYSIKAGVNADFGDNSLDFQGSAMGHIYNALGFKVGGVVMTASPTLIGLGIAFSQGQSIPVINKTIPMLANRLPSAILLGGIGLAVNTLTPLGESAREFGMEMTKKPIPRLSDYRAALVPEELAAIGIGVGVGWQVAGQLPGGVRRFTGPVINRFGLAWNYPNGLYKKGLLWALRNTQMKNAAAEANAAYREAEGLASWRDIFKPSWENLRLAELESAAADGRMVWLNEEAQLKYTELTGKINDILFVAKRDTDIVLQGIKQQGKALEEAIKSGEKELLRLTSKTPEELAKLTAAEARRLENETRIAQRSLKEFREKREKLKNEALLSVQRKLSPEERAQLEQLQQAAEDVKLVSTYSPNHSLQEYYLREWKELDIKLVGTNLKLERAQGQLEGVVEAQKATVQAKVEELEQKLKDNPWLPRLEKSEIEIELERARGRLEGVPTEELKKKELTDKVAKLENELKKDKENLHAIFPTAAQKIKEIVHGQNMTFGMRFTLVSSIYTAIQAALSPYGTKDDSSLVKYAFDFGGWVWRHLPFTSSKPHEEEFDLYYDSKEKSLGEEVIDTDEEDEELQ